MAAKRGCRAGLSRLCMLVLLSLAAEANDQALSAPPANAIVAMNLVEEASAAVVCKKNHYYWGMWNEKPYCVQCPTGMISAGCTNCKPDPHGSICSRVDSCPKGKFHTGPKTCDHCPAGKWQPMHGQKGCFACSAGMFQDKKGSHTCQQCPLHTYQSEPGKSSCQKCTHCAEGQYGFTERVGGSDAADCLCTKCQAGKYTPKGYTQCFSCKEGKFAAAVGAPECTACPAGKFQRTKAATSCTACKVGFITYFDEATEASDCVAQGGDKHFCKAGRFISYHEEKMSYSCNKCPAGKFGGVISGYQYGGRCFDCPGGKFQAGDGNTHCDVCPQGYIQAQGFKKCVVSPTHMPTTAPTLQPTAAPSEPITAAPTNQPTQSPLPTPQWHKYVHRIPHLLPNARKHPILSPWTESPTPSPTLIPTHKPIDCDMSPWEMVSDCSVTCGEGHRTFKRHILTPSKYDGHCGNLIERRFCSEGPCPQNCVVSDWGKWSECTKSCSSGKKSRTRSVVSHADKAGYTCPLLTETITCNSQPCPVDCVLLGWSHWSQCSATCGGGSAFRVRSASRETVYGGKCSHRREDKQCNTHVCAQDCVVSKWGKWSECSTSCGPGIAKRQRMVLKQKSNGGKACPNLEHEQTCEVAKHCPIDCEMSPWGAWSTCTISCAPIDQDVAGTWNRTRTMVKPAKHGGKACPPIFHSTECNRYNICPVHCTVTKWTAWQACSKSCGVGVSTRSRSIKIKAKHSGAHCPTLQESKPCNQMVCPTPIPTETPTPAPTGTPTTYPTNEDTTAPTPSPSFAPTHKPVHCQVSKWSEWSNACTKSCGTGYKSRSRTIVQDPMYYGESCPPLIDQKLCNKQACPLDCETTDWSAWTECSVSCGKGNRSRTRSMVAETMNGGKPCPALTASEECNLPCPSHCVLSNWTKWGECDATCGNGKKMRTRTVVEHAKNGGFSCPPLNETEACNTHACPVSCAVSEWSAWSDCDKACGVGQKSRRREILTQPSEGGASCPKLFEEAVCELKECTPCQYSRWAAWTECSLTCGGGSRFRRRRSRLSRSRSRSSTTTAEDAKACPPTQYQTELCNAAPCPKDCVVNQWDAWSECSKTCGIGTHSRMRRIHRYPSMGGQACPPLAETRVCNAFLCPVDCKVGEWGRFGRCSTTCGGGARRRSRRVTRKAESGGMQCPTTVQTEACSTHICSRDCRLTRYTPFSECSRTCGSGTQTHTREVHTAPTGDGKECGPLSEVRTCHQGHCPVDCLMSDWSKFTKCSKSCDGGKQTRRRDVIRRPAFGGMECAMTEETWPCNVQECPIDCQMSKWSQWTECSTTCEKGVHSRTRTVMLKPSFGGKACGKLAEQDACTEGPCPVGCETTPWNKWTTCSKLCGSGTQGRMRHITNMDPSKPGFMCPLLWETRPCNEHPCPADCEVSAWTEWTVCDRTCNGGLQYRERSVTKNTVPGGKECPSLSAHKKCNQHYCPEDCELTPFGPWSPCSRTCGTGSRTRSKAILADEAYGGKFCALEKAATEECATQACPIDCVLSDWSAWGECTVSCGTGEEVRARTVEKAAHSGGQPCGSLAEVRICNAPPHLACPLDCVVGNWSAWTSCSASCDSGDRLRMRPVAVPEAFGGKGCPSLSQRERCNTHACPTDCEVGRWSRFSPCSTTCGPGRQRRTRKVATKPVGGGAACPSLEFVESCSEGSCPVHCVVSKWSDWTPCSVSCGGGSQSRTRAVEQHAFHGGYTCPSLRERQTCGGMRCPSDCSVTRWSRWSRCPVTCGSGSVTRTRRVRRRASHGGRDCPVLTEESDCAVHDCPVDCVVAEFGAWSACSAACGSGITIRERSVKIQNNFGGKLCPVLEERKHCAVDKPCPKDCMVSEWKPWTACAVTCGGGKSARWRTITYMPMQMGMMCPPLYEVKDCNAHSCPIDCELSPWESIGECSTSCGAGVQQRRRTVVAAAKFGGASCPSEALRISSAACDGARPCPARCEVSEWGEWGECSKSCGMGTHARTRRVTNHANTTGYACPALEESRDCNDQPCSLDCVLGGWGNWTECGVSCGTGERWRKRVIVQAPKFGGVACKPAFKTKKCATQPCPEDCVMSAWGEWSDCTASCGSGSTTRSRTIMGDNRYGGRACPNLDMWKQCNKHHCPIDCVVGHFGDWSPCSRSCGGGLSVRTRSVKVQNMFNGLACPKLREEMQCNRIPCALDCQVGEWVDAPCSKSCGGGTQKRTRAVKSVGVDGGKGCPALASTRKCATQACPVDCKVSDWLSLGACSKTCGKGVRMEHRKIEVHAQFGGVPCTSKISFAKMVDCVVSAACPVHCDVTGWGVWSECDKTCGGGHRIRTRSIVRHASFGGFKCPNLSQKRECDNGKCPVHCEVSNWAPWSACSTTCDSDEKLGSMSRVRKVTQQDVHGGASCPQMFQSKPCSGWRTKCPVHCSVSQWGKWTGCSKSCGGGLKLRTRSVVAHAQHRGYVCPSLKDTEPCGTEPCPSEDGVVTDAPPTPSPSVAPQTPPCKPGEKIFINWLDSATTKTNVVSDENKILTRIGAKGGRNGEILGELNLTHSGPWRVEAVFEASAEDGADERDFVHASINDKDLGKVHNKKVYYKSDKSVSTYIPRGQSVAKFWFRWFTYTKGSKQHMGLVDKSIATCMATKQDCRLTQWGKWSKCTKSCAGGWQSRVRQVAVPARFGGKPCAGLTEHRECNEWMCPWEHVMQAESAFDGVSKIGPVSLVNVHTSQKGYTGKGYLQFGSSTSENVEWKFTAPFTGRYEISFRYALGGSRATATAATEHMEIDHTYSVNVDFQNTGGWNHWSWSTIGVDLRRGMNTVSLRPARLGGVLYLDSVKLSHAKYLQHCKPGTQIPLHWLHAATKNSNVVEGATVGEDSFSGELDGRIELGAMGPWDIHLTVRSTQHKTVHTFDTAKTSEFHDLTAKINGRRVKLQAGGSGDTHKIVIKDGGAHLSYNFAWETLGGSTQGTQVLNGVAVCGGCSHTKCAFEHHPTLGSRIRVHHHNREYGGANHQCAWDDNMDTCACRCQNHPFMSKAQKHKIDHPKRSESECKNEPFFKFQNFDGTLQCDRSTEWLSGGRLKMASRNGAYLTGIETSKCKHLETTTAAMIAAQKGIEKKFGYKTSDMCVAKASCCDSGISQHRAQQCKDVSWVEKKNGKETFKAQAGWSNCPTGFFVTTMSRRHNSMPFATITGAKCCKNMNGPGWGDCVTIAAERSGWSTCDSGYFVAGIFRNEGCRDLDCVSKVRCCRPLDEY